MFLAYCGRSVLDTMKSIAPITPLSEDVDDWNLARQWNAIDWNKAEKHVNRLQYRISKAEDEGKHDLAKRLSHLLTHSFYAKALAVRRVTTNQGKRTAGVDNVIWKSASEKMKALLSLKDKGYKSSPLKRIYIPKKSGKLRPLSIPTMYDRAMQALYALALDPIAEVRADPNSYGFRRFRGCQDAQCAIWMKTHANTKGEWIVETDIKSCFDQISHKWILDNIPMDKRILKQFLKSGFIFRNTLFPNINGVPQGGIISPIIANMALDGLERELADKFPNRGRRPNPVKLVRYADDSVAICRDKVTAEKVKKVMSDFLAPRGLQLSEEKTRITHIDEGFDFIGFNFRRYNGHLITKPAKSSIKRLVERMHLLILEEGQAMSQTELIRVLNPILRGWSEYYRHVCSGWTFATLDHILFWILWRWAVRRHPRKGKKWIKNRYWHRVGNRSWVFTDGETELFGLRNVKIRRHRKVKEGSNAYLDYWYIQGKKSKRAKSCPKSLSL